MERTRELERAEHRASLVSVVGREHLTCAPSQSEFWVGQLEREAATARQRAAEKDAAMVPAQAAHGRLAAERGLMQNLVNELQDELKSARERCEESEQRCRQINER